MDQLGSSATPAAQRLIPWILSREEPAGVSCDAEDIWWMLHGGCSNAPFAGGCQEKCPPTGRYNE